MDLKPYNAIAKRVAGLTGDPDHEMEILSILVEYALTHPSFDINKIGVKEAKSLLYRKTVGSAYFAEIGEVTIGDEDDDRTLLSMQGHEETPEKLLGELQEPEPELPENPEPTCEHMFFGLNEEEERLISYYEEDSKLSLRRAALVMGRSPQHIYDMVVRIRSKTIVFEKSEKIDFSKPMVIPVDWVKL